MRWLQTDPIGVIAGNNYYKFVGNGPTNEVDPSGFDAWDEKDARDTLIEQVKEWRSIENYDVAANILEHFLANSGKPYVLKKSDQEIVSRESERLVRRVIARKFQFDKSPFDVVGKKIYYKGEVRWVDDGIKGALDKKYHCDERYMDTNPPLFYAFGGARMNLNGTVIASKAGKRTRDGHYFTIKVKTKITISDNYSFLIKGPLNSKLYFRPYSAAHYLEVFQNYKPFFDSVTFEKNI